GGQAVTAQETARRRDAIAGHSEDDATKRATTPKRYQRVDEQGDTMDRQVLLGPAASHSGPDPARGNHGHRASAITAAPHREAFASGNRAKIMRPAAVCSTVVTVTSTFWPMKRLP